jgi:hypothetical protein
MAAPAENRLMAAGGYWGLWVTTGEKPDLLFLLGCPFPVVIRLHKLPLI